MNYSVNQATLAYAAQGQTQKGNDEVLLDKAIDLTARSSWAPQGFTVDTFYTPNDYASFQQETNDLLSLLWRKAGLKIDAGFPPEKYHEVVASQQVHLAAIEQTKLISVSLFPLGIQKLEQRISEICNYPLKALNPYDGQSVFHFRVVRPQSKDNNPLHRDVWLEDYKDCINLYLPVAGSDEQSSLIIAPGSHRWPESKVERTISGAEINGIKFNVPAVTAIEGASEFVRPNPALNEVLVFSPYLIHGGATNLNTETTRISIELRLWKNQA